MKRTAVLIMIATAAYIAGFHVGYYCGFHQRDAFLQSEANK